MKRFLFALALILPLAACGGGDEGADLAEEEEATPPDATAATALSYLNDHVGKYPGDVELWTTEPLASRLQTLLGEHYGVFVENVAVVGPIAEEEGMIYVMGNKENRGGIDSAVIVADVANDNVKVWLLQEGNVREFVEKDMFVKLPSEAVVHIAGWNEGS
jgi:hypothetical protein